MSSKKQLTRRDFLKIVAVGSIAGVTAKLGWDSLSQETVISETRLLMGTVVNLKVVNGDPVAARQAVQTCLNRMEELETVLSHFKPKSQLSILNKHGYLARPDEAFIKLIRKSHEICELTNGAFDITVKPLLDLYKNAQKNGQGLPTDAEIQKARQHVDYKSVLKDDDQITFVEPEMAITLDGIAKGYIVDAGVKILREYGFTNVMVEAGGDLLASGQKSLNNPWKIGVNSPRQPESLLSKLDVTNKAIATSGDYMQTFSADYVHHHIIDPRTGYSSPELASATVVAPSVMLADALATAMIVLDAEDGIQLGYQIPEVEVFLVSKDLLTHQTRNFPVAH